LSLSTMRRLHCQKSTKTRLNKIHCFINFLFNFGGPMLKISKCGLKPHLLIYLLIDINIKLYVTQAERFLVKKKTFGYLSKNRSFHEKKNHSNYRQPELYSALQLIIIFLFLLYFSREIPIVYIKQEQRGKLCYNQRQKKNL